MPRDATCCYGNDGQLSVVDTGKGQTCRQNQTALNWNQTGPAGPAGPQGPAGVSNYQIVYVDQPVYDTPSMIEVYCPAGDSVFGGGYFGNPGLDLWNDGPTLPNTWTQPGTGWVIRGESTSGTQTVRAYAICGTTQ